MKICYKIVQNVFFYITWVDFLCCLTVKDHIYWNSFTIISFFNEELSTKLMNTAEKHKLTVLNYVFYTI